jgi:hypothetical protein
LPTPKIVKAALISVLWGYDNDPFIFGPQGFETMIYVHCSHLCNNIIGLKEICTAKLNSRLKIGTLIVKQHVKQFPIFPLLSADIPVDTNCLCIKNIELAISNWQVLTFFFVNVANFTRSFTAWCVVVGVVKRR